MQIFCGPFSPRSSLKRSVRRLITAQSGDGPVPADAGRKRRQLEDKRPDVGLGVGVRSRDVDSGVGPGSLADLRLLGYQHGSVVVDVNQVDLERPGPAGLGRTCGREGRRKRRHL